MPFVWLDGREPSGKCGAPRNFRAQFAEFQKRNNHAANRGIRPMVAFDGVIASVNAMRRPTAHSKRVRTTYGAARGLRSADTAFWLGAAAWEPLTLR